MVNTGHRSDLPGLGGGQRGACNEPPPRLRERREREEETRAEAEELGAEVEEPLFLPTTAFMASAGEECE